MTNLSKKIYIIVFACVFARNLIIPSFALACTEPDPYCELELTKIDNIDPVNPGDELIYSLRLENVGTADCTGTGVRIQDEFDTNTEYVSSTKAPETITATYIKWNFGTITPGEVENLDLTMLVSEETECGSVLINKAKFWSNQTCWGDYVIEETIVECPPEPTGSITVCKIVIDSESNIVDGSEVPGADFSISGFIPEPTPSTGVPVGEIPNSIFVTPLSFTDDLLYNDQINEAECITYSDLALGGYYYDQELLPAEGWERPLYNDQFAVEINDLGDFFEYDNKLFDGNLLNDDERDTNADGHIVLTEGRPDRTLVVLNQYEEIVEPFCGDGILDDGEECEAGLECYCTEGYVCNLETCICDEVPPEPYCGDGIVNGTEECEADIDCDDQDETTIDTCNACVCENTPLPQCETDPDCDDGLTCNGLETCVGNQCVAGITVDCSGNYISGIDTCDNSPDDNPFTRDFRFEFTSVCEEPTGTCTTGDETIDHTCDVGCGGCESDVDCDDQDENTTDTCNLETCACEHTPVEQPECGNEVVEDGEQCDDGNLIDGDGCSSTCQLEQIEPYCGDGVINGEEQCDDGGSNGQVCSPNCESTCTYCSSSCTIASVTGDSCGGGGGGVTRYCGDGLLTVSRGEECDDRNKINGDGCSSTCKIEEVAGATTEEEPETEILGGRIELPDTGQNPLIYVLIGIGLLIITGAITKRYFVPERIVIDF